MLKDGVDLQSIRRVLVTKLRHHGDVLLASPVFSVLKNHAPHVEVDALVYADTAVMLTGNPSISRVFAIDRGWKGSGLTKQVREEWGLLQQLRRRDYDMLIHLSEHPRGAWLARLLGPRYSVAANHPRVRRWWKNSFTHIYPLPMNGRRHVVETNLDALRRIGVQPGELERKLCFVPGEEAEREVVRMLGDLGLVQKGYIHLHPASRWQFKCWPAEKTADLIDKLQALGERVLVTAAPDAEELELVARIRALATTPFADLCGKLTLKQLGAVSRNARLFIGVDSAPMHTASAMQTPVVALFGPSGEFNWGPWQVAHRVVASGHSCRPCGNDGCGGGKVSECLTTLPVSEVLQAVQALKSRF
ncbi:MAG: putative lipopolysaccharide heptosyltransferase III [Betaproteobacteria bacterium]|nr:putative lipopolysaccharide heptosyltransferase III [Betaproteobacteria bacterium]